MILICLSLCQNTFFLVFVTYLFIIKSYKFLLDILATLFKR